MSRTVETDVIPGARTVCVTSGKGGVGKTTTAVALAARLAADGHDVIVLDADVAGPNVTLVGELTDMALSADADTVALRLPRTPHGFRVASGDILNRAGIAGVHEAGTIVQLARFDSPCDIVIVDLPPGWTGQHSTICGYLPDMVISVVAPTATSVADHGRHLAAWEKAYVGLDSSNDNARRSAKRTIVRPAHVAVETMARFIGVSETDGTTVVVRRSGTIDAATMAEQVAPVVSIPAAATIADAAATDEIGALAALVGALGSDTE
jgi:MinD-like ATPase involved in chromosome partitioning or flagellar assembly